MTAILTPLRDRSVAAAMKNSLIHHSFGTLIHKKVYLVAHPVRYVERPRAPDTQLQ
jgi:hypothetical protein